MEFTLKEAERQQPYAYWLGITEGIGNSTREKLVAYAGSPEKVYKMEEKELKGFLSERKAKKIAESRKDRNPVAEYEQLKERGIKYYPVFHPLYPKRLKLIEDRPFGIFVEGRLPEEDRASVAVIGARACSEYGRFLAGRCGRELAEAGINVISGMARGIDGIGQRAALEAGGNSYAVLGCGTNICYPGENKDIYVRAKKNGGIISEYPPDRAPSPRLFPPRNRIISGLADAVLIIEARLKSGTLITADMALEQGKEVYAVPGRVTDVLSEGCNGLIRQGAGVFTSVRELLEETGLAYRKTEEEKKEKDQKEAAEESEMSESEKRVFIQLDFYPKDTEQLIKETGIPYRQLINILVKLCMEGKAEKVSAGQFIKKRL